MHIQMERLYKAAKALKGFTTQAEIARALNQSSQTVNNWESRGISKSGMLKAQSAFGCSATWLESGEGVMNVESAEPGHGLKPGTYKQVVASHDTDAGVTHIKKVKLRLSAGIMGYQVEPENYEGTTLTVPSAWIESRGYASEKLIAIRVRGESMEPTLYADDLVIINTADTVVVDGQVYAVNYEGEAVIKRLTRDAGRWWLTSDNSDQRKYHRKSCEGNECIIVGRVVKRESERF